jgi:transposase-like protein
VRRGAPSSTISLIAACKRSEFLIVDGALGLDKAIAVVWDGVPVQRCTVHYAALRIMPTSAAKPAWQALISVKDAA